MSPPIQQLDYDELSRWIRILHAATVQGRRDLIDGAYAHIRDFNTAGKAQDAIEAQTPSLEGIGGVLGAAGMGFARSALGSAQFEEPENKGNLMRATEPPDLLARQRTEEQALSQHPIATAVGETIPEALMLGLGTPALVGGLRALVAAGKATIPKTFGGLFSRQAPTTVKGLQPISEMIGTGPQAAGAPVARSSQNVDPEMLAEVRRVLAGEPPTLAGYQSPGAMIGRQAAPLGTVARSPRQGIAPETDIAELLTELRGGVLPSAARGQEYLAKKGFSPEMIQRILSGALSPPPTPAVGALRAAAGPSIPSPAQLAVRAEAQAMPVPQPGMGRPLAAYDQPPALGGQVAQAAPPTPLPSDLPVRRGWGTTMNPSAPQASRVGLGKTQIQGFSQVKQMLPTLPDEVLQQVAQDAKIPQQLRSLVLVELFRRRGLGLTP